jgi:hypothetical protein
MKTEYAKNEVERAAAKEGREEDINCYAKMYQLILDYEKVCLDLRAAFKSISHA